jgi:YesN/AraC family two-component response regulator
MITHASGEQALDLSREFHGTIHVLVSDMAMPKLDGLSLRQQTLRERPTIKVLLTSGSAGQAFEGVTFLTKAVQPGTVRRACAPIVGIMCS